MKKFRFFVHFKGCRKATDWIYCDSEMETTTSFLSKRGEHNGVVDEEGNTHYINWDNVNYSKCEEVK